MAAEVNDTAFAAICNDYTEKGIKRNMETQLFNGEYFIHQPDKIKEKVGDRFLQHLSYRPVYGQAGLSGGMDRVIDRGKTLSALKALYKYNFKA